MTRATPFFALLILGAVAHAEVIELEGTVKSIDVEARTLTIERKTAKGEKAMTVDVASSAGDLASVKAGSRISFSYDNTLEVVTSLQTGSEAKQLFVAGSEWATGDGGLRIRVMHVDGDAFVGLMYGKGPDMLRELHGELKGSKVSWLAKNVVALKGNPGEDNFGTIRSDKDGARIDFRYGADQENATKTFGVRRVTPSASNSK
jgi:hypothetical protein